MSNNDVFQTNDDFSSQRNMGSKFYSWDERKLLLKILNKYYDIVNNKKVNGKTTNEKNQAWDAIQEEFNASSIAQYPRTAHQLRRCYGNTRAKAKKGDTAAQKLLKWATRFQLPQKIDNELKTGADSGNMGVKNNADTEDFQSDSEDLSANNSHSELVEFIDESLQRLSSENVGGCQHCHCDKAERIAKLRLVKFEQEQIQRVHNAKLQTLRLKSKRNKELHRLAVHEMTLRVENERRRAEILEKELSLHS